MVKHHSREVKVGSIGDYLPEMVKHHSREVFSTFSFNDYQRNKSSSKSITKAEWTQ